MEHGEDDWTGPEICPRCEGTGTVREKTDSGETCVAECRVCEGTGLMTLIPLKHPKALRRRLRSFWRVLRRYSPRLKGRGRGGRGIRSPVSKQYAGSSPVPEVPVPESASPMIGRQRDRADWPALGNETQAPVTEPEMKLSEPALAPGELDDVNLEVRIPESELMDRIEMDLSRAVQTEPLVVDVGFSAPAGMDGTLTQGIHDSLPPVGAQATVGYEATKPDGLGLDFCAEPPAAGVFPDGLPGAGIGPVPGAAGQPGITDIGSADPLADDPVLNDPLLGP